MTEAKKTGNGGISISIVHIAMVVCAVVIAALLVMTSIQTANTFSRLNRETGNYIVRQKAAHDLMEGSDYLTEMVQRFVLEGDTKFLDNYFEEAFVSKRRETSIVSMSENHAEESLVEQLQEALNESQSLMYREYYAMKLVLEARELGDYNETLRAIELKEEDMLSSAEEKQNLAEKMVLGSEYYASKEIIRTKLRNSLDMMDKAMAAARQQTNAEIERELQTSRVATIVMVVAILLLSWLSASMSSIPLIKASRNIREQKPIPVTGAKEFRHLAEDYNAMHEELHRTEKET